MEIGNKIKQLRQKMGLTQEELASRCELSTGFISQVERDLTSPSISTLESILSGVGVSIQDFFKPEKQEVMILNDESKAVKVLKKEDYSISWIVPDAQRLNMEPIILDILPDGETKIETPHEGEEFGFVLKGSIVLVMNESEYRVNKGEYFYFMPFKDHHIKNNSGKPAKVLWISSPPSF